MQLRGSESSDMVLATATELHSVRSIEKLLEPMHRLQQAFASYSGGDNGALARAVPVCAALRRPGRAHAQAQGAPATALMIQSEDGAAAG